MKVFISYVAKDSQWARAIAEILKRAGHDVFLDLDELYPGDNWALEIGQALQNSHAVVLIVSPAYVASDSSMKELGFILGQRRFEGRAIPVLVRATRQLPQGITLMPMIDARDKDPRDAGREILSALKMGSPLDGKEQTENAGAHG